MGNLDSNSSATEVNGVNAFQNRDDNDTNVTVNADTTVLVNPKARSPFCGQVETNKNLYDKFNAKKK